MTIIGEAFIEVKPDSKGFANQAERGVLGPLGSVAKKAAGIVGGIFAVQKGFSFLSDSVAEARESNKVAAQTEAVIKSTGAAAGLTAKQFGDLSTAISNKTAVDDEEIQKAANLLATFTNVRNEVGKGNDIFSQSTEVLVDMGKALGTDTAGSAIQLGKALNDPIKGISALTRVGVTFTDQQREQIKTLQESGDVAGAQRVILAELRKEFGGSAAAQANAGDRLRVTFGNIKEELGAKLLPVIDRVATALADHLPGAMATTEKVVSRVVGVVGPIVSKVAVGVQALIAAFKDPDVTSDGFVGVMEQIGSTARKVFDTLLPVVRKVFDFLQKNARPILIAVAAAFALITAPVTTVVVALLVLYTRSKLVRDAVQAMVDGIRVFVDFVRTKVVPAVAPVVAAVVKAFSDLGRGVAERMDAIQEAIGHVLTAVKVLVAVALAPIVLLWRQFGDDILKVVGIAFRAVQDQVGTAIRIVRDIIDAVLALINGDWGKAWDAIKDIPLAALGFLQRTIGRAVEAIGVVLQAAVDGVARLWSLAWDKLKAAPQLLIDFVVGLPGRVAGAVADLVSAGANIGSKIFEGIVGAFKGLADLVLSPFRAIFRAIAELWNSTVGKLRFEVPSWIPGIGGKGFDVPDIPVPQETGGGGTSLHLASGAVVSAMPGRGVVARIGEGSRPELVAPLPPGFMSAMERIAAGGEWGGSPQIQVLTHPGMDKYDVAERVALELTTMASRKGWV